MEIKRVPDDAQRFTAGGSFRDSSPDGAPPARISRVRHIKSVYSSPTPDESRDIETYINRAIIGPFPDNQIPSLPVQHTDLEQSNTGDVSAHPSEFVQTLPTDLPYGYSGETGNLAAFLEGRLQASQGGSTQSHNDDKDSLLKDPRFQIFVDEIADATETVPNPVIRTFLTSTVNRLRVINTEPSTEVTSELTEDAENKNESNADS